MAKPNPQGGLVIRYDYLWASEEREGREEGTKNRACAIILTMPLTKVGEQRVVLCAITHSPPEPPEEGVPIPLKVKRYLGLDDDLSWAIVSEANLVDWEDPGIVPNDRGNWTYGFVPPILAQDMVARLMARYNAGQLPLVNRPAIEKRRAERDGARRVR